MKFEKMTKAQIIEKIESIPADMLNSAVTAIRYSNPLNVISTNRVNVYTRSNRVTKIEFQSRATKQNMIAVYTEILDRIAVYYGIEKVHNIEAEYTPAWWEDDTAPAEDPEAVTLAPAEDAQVWDENGETVTPDTDTEEEEEEQNMKPEYKHIYVEEARRQLEARTDRSAWDRAVTEDAIDLLDTVNDRCEQVTRQFADTEEGGAAHVHDLFVSRVSLMNIMKNGADSWHDYSWGGCGLIYDGDIAEHYCTPSELKKVHGGERRPNSREEWLDVQARALRQAAGRAADALIAASHKTYTVG